MLRHLLLASTMLTLLAIPFASALTVHVTTGPYGEPCVGTDATDWVIVCVGKGIIRDDPTDCVVHLYVAFAEQRICVPIA